ncbi:MAG: hypothetical protein J5608_01275 [Alphaproteobacteria bacterium]|nr:hypothetical protein [Alphaproteobacteria bacterium]
MKKTFKFLFLVAFLLMPAVVSAVDCGAHSESAQQCAEYSTNLCTWNGSACVEKCPTEGNTCQYWDGCYVMAESCSPCDAKTYNDDNSATECKSCGSYSDNVWNWANTASSHPDYSVFDSQYDDTTGISFCPWKCEDGWYESNDYVAETGAGECMNCPKLRADDGHQPVISLNEEQDFIGHCKCNTNNPGGSNLIKHFDGSGYKYFCGICGAGAFSNNFGSVQLDINGVMPDSTQGIPGVCGCYLHANRVGGTAQNDQDQLVECKCPADSHPINGDCKCDDNMVMVQDSDGLWRCESCPQHSVPNGDGCECLQNYYNANTDVNEMPTCERCPSGTFKVAGNAGIAECQMDYRTKFCDRNGQNCMQLIPES